MDNDITTAESYTPAELERRRQGQIFGTAEELRVLRTINARANAMRRLAGSKLGRPAKRLTRTSGALVSRVA